MSYRLKFIVVSFILMVGLIGMVLLLPSQLVYAETFNPGCNPLELINAINMANSNNEADTINLPEGCVYNLTEINNTHPERDNTGLPLITTTITINGNGSTIRRESGGDYRLIFITATNITTGNLTLNNITLTNGNVPDQGGAILNYFGALTLNNSTLIDNSADEGGAINNNDGASTTIINSTIISNTASTAVGGILNISVPPNPPNVLRIINSTISHNGGAFYSDSNGLENHGSGASTVMTNTILADNEFSDCANSDNGFLFSGGTNLIETNFNCVLTATDIITNPKLGPLQDNGGDTLTMALLENSPALDAGNNAGCPATDQRGVSRPQSMRCDIGAFEFSPPEIAVLGNNQVIADGDSSPSVADFTDFGNVTLGEAITRTFTISGTGDLYLTGTPVVSLTGAATDDFSVIVNPTPPVIFNITTTFQVRFTPSVTGTRITTVTIANNDRDKNPYNFVIQGIGITQSLVYLPMVIKN